MATFAAPVQGVGLRSRAEARTTADERESRFRLCMAAALLGWDLVRILGGAWDIAWHVLIGRDSFWSPPHTMLYLGVSGAGAIALAVVLIETWRFRRGGEGVTETNSVAFGPFRAPIGFFVVGFGALTTVVSAPLDGQWHMQYGLDVTLWAPFHVMAMLGGMITAVGVIYILASEVNRRAARQADQRRWLGFAGPQWMLGLAFALLSSGMLGAIRPARALYPFTELGPIRLLTYPILVGFVVGFILVAMAWTNRRVGSAAMVAGFQIVIQIVVVAFITAALSTVASVQELAYRRLDGAFGPALRDFAWTGETFGSPIGLIVAAVVIELLVISAARRGATTRRSAWLMGGAGALAMALLARPWASLPSLSPLAVQVAVLGPALPVAVAAGVVGGSLGSGLGAVLRRLAH